MAPPTNTFTFRPNGQVVAVLRQRAGYSRATLAAAMRRAFAERQEGDLRCTEAVIRRIEIGGGKYQPHERVTWSLAKVLGVTIDELCGVVVVIEHELPVGA